MEIQGLGLRDIGVGQIVCARSRCLPSTEGNRHQELLEFGSARFERTYNFRLTQK
jgi:hypothetical protein